MEREKWKKRGGVSNEHRFADVSQQFRNVCQCVKSRRQNFRQLRARHGKNAFNQR